jgi:hypothetical protein
MVRRASKDNEAPSPSGGWTNPFREPGTSAPNAH